MSARNRNLARVGLAVVFLVAAILACGPAGGGRAVTVVINSPVGGASVAVGQEVLIDSTATANAGVDRVELAVNGVVVRRDMPPSGNPTTFRVSQPWTPAAEGQVQISVVAFDVNGSSSDAAAITLQVVASGAVLPTATTMAAATAVPGGPTETPPPPVTTEAGCTLDSQYVTDVTIPDGTIMTLGAGFVKTWRVRNSGTCDWDAGFQLIFVGGNQMNGPANVSLPAVAAGSQTDISVSLTAPNSYGTHKGTWRIRSIDGDVFGTNLTVVINIPAPATDTPPPTETPLPTETSLPTLPPPAVAPFTKYVISQVNVAAGNTGAAIATCPSDSIVVGGGYAANHTVTFYTQYKYGNGWRGDAKNNDSSSQQITVFAVCLYGVPGASVTQVHAQATVTPGDKEQAVATCPAGSVATGGGFHAYPDGSLRVYNSSKADSGEGWQSWAYNNSGSNKTHHAYAMCLSGTGGSTTDVLKSVDIPASSTGYGIPTCGSGSLVTGGGFAAQDDLLIYSTSGPYSDDEWRVYAKNTYASDDRLLFAYAICLTLP
jgi:hypothetical protein